MTRYRALVLALVGACAVSPKPGPRPITPPQPEACEAAEAKLRVLDCRRDDGSPWATTPAGTPFAQACRRALADGRDWKPQCIAKIEVCSVLMCAYRGECCGS